MPLFGVRGLVTALAKAPTSRRTPRSGATETEPLHNVGKLLFHATKVEHPAGEQRHDNDGRNQYHHARRFRFAEQRPTKTLHYADHRIESVKHAPTSGNDRTRISNRRCKQPELDQKVDRVTHVAILHV